MARLTGPTRSYLPEVEPGPDTEAEASDPSTPVPRLEELRRHHPLLVLANPNVSFATVTPLFRYAVHGTAYKPMFEALLSNPSLPLFLLDQPILLLSLEGSRLPVLWEVANETPPQRWDGRTTTVLSRRMAESAARLIRRFPKLRVSLVDEPYRFAGKRIEEWWHILWGNVQQHVGNIKRLQSLPSDELYGHVGATYLTLAYELEEAWKAAEPREWDELTVGGLAAAKPLVSRAIYEAASPHSIYHLRRKASP